MAMVGKGDYIILSIIKNIFLKKEVQVGSYKIVTGVGSAAQGI